ncbi:ribonuclease H-like domain-containing protein [Tanacetum coccineum]
MANTRRYREYDLAYLKLVFEFPIYRVWNMVDTALNTAYCLLLDMAYWILFPSWSLVSAGTRCIFLVGYGVLVVKTVIFRISSFKLQNACLLVNLHQTLFDVITLGQETTLAHAFTAAMLHDPTTGARNMDTCESSHLNALVTNLNNVFNMCIYPSIAVGDGHSIPVTNTGYSILPTLFRSIHLNNVLITPHIVKNLISIHQLVRNNNCTIEFDAFGFSVKDFLMRRVLLRCDSSRDLYPVTTLSLIPHASLSVSIHGINVLDISEVKCYVVLCPINSFRVIKRNLPCFVMLVSSDTVVTSCFDIIHSDVWTSPIPSLSGFKYDVLFLDHYSQFVWVYPPINKSDVLSKFVLFRTYVRTQFKCEIWSFQCDHGGEFNNRNLHKLFADNGNQFHGTLSRYKARLMANGSTQLEGVDVDETFSPVVKLIYMHQPPRFRASTYPAHVCLLQWSLYGLKQAPRAWFQRHVMETTYLLLYFDDIVLTTSSQPLLQRIIASLHQEKKLLIIDYLEK